MEPLKKVNKAQNMKDNKIYSPKYPATLDAAAMLNIITLNSNNAHILVQHFQRVLSSPIKEQKDSSLRL